MTGVVFDAADFKARYPQFSAVGNAVLENQFDMATLYLANNSSSVVKSIDTRRSLLYLLTAHIATLMGVLSASNTPAPAGRLASASEGSVSTSFDFPSNPSAAWFNQTQYGSMFWMATARFRSGVYVPASVVPRGLAWRH